ncbi:MAG: 1-deoxy-D-xylulose-5-phosphate reductoisomerase [Erysipelotrichaceae bacterium]|nr:1-deoxy-D-xylulose-5-phosphate reductoisomerase [Erysipelotrichaceae bacterium]
MKKILLLGASGSIGLQTIDVIKNHPDQYVLTGFSVGRQVAKAYEILACLKVEKVYVQDEEAAKKLQEAYQDIKVYHGKMGLLSLVEEADYDLLVNALVGFVGLEPTLKAISLNKDVALANKETLVVAGELVKKALKQHHVHLFPIDSEHSAIAQCLQGNKHEEIKKLIFTASGGSFRDKTRDQLKDVTLQDTLKHPNWAMGAKITIDSATMMNKGLEVIEAHYLFDVDYEDIDVLLHRESIVHSMVEYVDNSIMAQLGNADMRLPIQYALSYPARLSINTQPLDLVAIGSLHFEKMDMERYPLLALAYEVGKKGGNLPCIMNGANEEANFAFQKGEIAFLDIERLVFKAVEAATYAPVETLEDILAADKWVRAFVREQIEVINK